MKAELGKEKGFWRHRFPSPPKTPEEEAFVRRMRYDQ